MKYSQAVASMCKSFAVANTKIKPSLISSFHKQILTLLLAFLLTGIAAYGQSTPTGLSGGGTLFAPVVAAYDKNLMYVACDMTGIYRSKDGGQNWQLLDGHSVRISYALNNSFLNGTFATYAFSVAIDPTINPATDPQHRTHIISSLGGAALMESFDGGDTWQAFGTFAGSTQPAFPSGLTITSAAFSPAGSFLVVGTTNGVQMLQNGVWTAKTFTGATDQLVKKIIFVKDPGTGRQIPVALTASNIYSWDGTNWNSIAAGLPTPPSGDRLQDMAGGSDSTHYVIYATVTTWQSGSSVAGGVYSYTKTSSNTPAFTLESAGLNYTIQVDTNCGNPSVPMYQFLGANDVDPGTAYVSIINNSCAPNVYKRSSSTNSWTGVYYPFQNSPDNVTPAWIDVSEPPNALGWGMGGTAHGFAGAPNDQNTAVFVNMTAVYVTNNGAPSAPTATTGPGGSKDWLQRYSKYVASNGKYQSNGLNIITAWNYVIHDVTLSNGTHVTAHFIPYSDVGLARSDDGGSTWVNITKESNTTKQWTNFYELAFEDAPGTRIWAAVSDHHDIPHDKELGSSVPIKNGAVIYSDDGGISWVRGTGTNLPAGPVASIQYRAGVLYASVWGDNNPGSTTPGGIYKSTDRGNSWNPVGNLPHDTGTNNHHFYQLHFDPSGTLYVSVAAQTSPSLAGGLYKFNGTAWQSLTSSMTNLEPVDYTFDSANAGVIYLCTESVGLGDGAAYKFNPSTSTWTPLGIPFPGTNIQAISPALITDGSGKRWLYIVTTTKGIWKADPTTDLTQAANWTEYTAVPFLDDHRMTVDPANANQLYVATYGAGAWKVTAATPTFTVSATPASATVVQGNSASYTATATPSGGFSGTVTWSVSGLPTGATSSFTPASVSISGTTAASSSLNVSTATTTPTGTYTLTITGTSGSTTKTTTVTLVVNPPPPDFIVSGSPGSQTVVAAGSASYTATATPLNGFSGTVTWSASGLPSGATASFAPTSVSISGTTAASSAMTVATSASTPAGTYTLTITGTSGSLSHSVNVTLSVTNFALSVAPASLSVAEGSSGSYTATVTAQNGFGGAVAFSVAGQPAGVTAAFAPTSVTGSGSSTLTVTVASTVAAGNYTLTISGTSGSLSHSVNVTLTVTAPPDFTITASPGSQTASPGGRATYTATISALNGFTGTVTLSASNLPTGATAAFSPTTVTTSGSSTLTVTTSSTTPLGAATLTVTGTSGSLTHSASVTLNMVAPGTVGMGGGAPLYAPVVSPSNGSIMFVGSELLALYRSTDGGQHWKILDQRKVQGSSRFSVAYDPARAGHVIAFHPFGGLMESFDDGATWAAFSPALPAGVTVTAAAFSSGSPSLLVGTTQGIYSLQGTVWQQQAIPATNQDVTAIAMVTDPSTSSTVAFASTLDDVYKWNGTAWTSFGSAFPARPAGNRVLGLVGSRGASYYVLYATVSTDPSDISTAGGVYRYESDLNAWSRQVNGLNLTQTNPDCQVTPTPQYQHLAVSASQPDTAYVSVVNTTCAPDVYKGTFSGGTMTWTGVLDGFQNHTTTNLTPGWIEMEPPTGLGWGFGGAANGIAVNPQDNNTVLFANTAALHMTSNGATTWTQKYTGAGSVSGHWQTVGLDSSTSWNYYVDPDPAKSNIRFIVHDHIGVSRSDDGGATWVFNNQAGTQSWGTFYQLAFEYPAGSRIWAAVSTEASIPHEMSLTATPGQGTVLVSSDDGATWTAAPVSGLPNGPVSSLVYRSGILYASVWGSGVYQSSDGGATWTSLGSPSTTSTHVHALHFDSSGVLYVSVAGTGSGSSFQSGGLYKYSAGAWQKLSAGLETLISPSKVDAMDFAFDPSASGVIYLCTAGVSGSNGGGGIYKYVTSTNTWTDMGLKNYVFTNFPQYHGDANTGSFVGFHPLVINGTLYVSTITHGIWKTANGGSTWQEFTGIPFQQTQRIIPDPLNSGQMYITTLGGGVWYSNQ